MAKRSGLRRKNGDDRQQLNVRVSAELKEELVAAARRRGKKLQDYVAQLITWARKERKLRRAKKKAAQREAATKGSGSAV